MLTFTITLHYAVELLFGSSSELVCVYMCVFVVCILCTYRFLFLLLKGFPRPFLTSNDQVSVSEL